MRAADARVQRLRKARNFGRFGFAAFGIAAVIGNVQAAPDNFADRAWHAFVPIAFILIVEFAINFVPEFSGKVQAASYAATGIIGTGAFVMSYASLLHVAQGAGMGSVSHLFPILFEITALTFSGCSIAASRTLADAEHAAAEAEQVAEQAAAEAERARVAREAEESARAAARIAREQAEAARVAASPPPPAPEPSQAERDALTLREEYGDTLPTYKAMSEAFGWSAGKVSEAVKAYRAQGPAPVEAAVR